MARPSIKEKRRDQIVKAAMSCVAQFGVSGLTLDKVAEMADLARPLIRHNVGNREQLVDAVTQRFIQLSTQKTLELRTGHNNDNSLRDTIEYLMDEKSSDTTLMLVAEALIAESANDPAIEKVMRTLLVNFVQSLEDMLAKEFSSASKEKLLAVATGITGIYFTVDSLSPISGLAKFNVASKEAIFLLIDQLS